MEITNKNFNTDKFSHGYINVYKNLFDNIRKEKLKILEVGIGSKEMPSLNFWKNYFENSHIYGIDIEELYINNDQERITTIKCSSLDKEDVDSKLSNLGPFDIIIDDGCHRCDGQQITFCNLFRLLNKEGIYIIEDLGFSFNSHFNGHFGKDIDYKKKKHIIGPPNKRIENPLPDFIYNNNDKIKQFTTYKVFHNFNKTRKLDSFYIDSFISSEEKENYISSIKTVKYWQGKKDSDSLMIINKI